MQNLKESTENKINTVVNSPLLTTQNKISSLEELKRKVLSHKESNELSGMLREEQKNTVSELLANVLPHVAEDGNGHWDAEHLVYEFGILYPSLQVGKQSNAEIVNKLAQRPSRRQVKMRSLQHNIEFRQSNRSADFISQISPMEYTSKQHFINRGQLLHTLFSEIITIHDIDEVINRLVFEGVIGSVNENEIRELTRHAFGLSQVREWYSGSWQLFNERDIIWRENGKLNTRRPDRVMVRG